MTTPRSKLIDRENGGYYHLISRCVRRAWLCGDDPLTGRNFDHRRAWIEARIIALTEIFPIDVYAYAVMSNHYHIVIHYRPYDGRKWSDAEVARRWLTLFPPYHDDALEASIQALLGDTQRIAVLRERLSDLSWYMRCLNEPIARTANREDGCTGRFWEGRFESKPLKDERAVYGCMAYADLNPVRAAMTDRLDAKQHTSLQRRLEQAKQDPACLQAPVSPLQFDRDTDRIVASTRPCALSLLLVEYQRHVAWTAGNIGGRKQPEPPNSLHDPTTWLAAQASFRRRSRASDKLPRWIADIATP